MNCQTNLVVIVPFFNESTSLPYLLSQLEVQTVVPERVLLVDSSSTDESVSVIEAWKKSATSRSGYELLQANTHTPGGSKTAGVLASHESFIAFMDCGLTFPATWLETQVSKLASGDADWISGVNVNYGINLWDRAAIAHTLGLGRARPAIPSSVIKRELFEKIGYFKDFRAGYDVEWSKRAKRAGASRIINPDVVIQYHAVNFADTWINIFFKSYTYAKPSVLCDSNGAPSIYIVALFTAGPLFVFVSDARLYLALAYVIGRLLVATTKSRWEIRYFFKSLSRLLVLVLVGLIIDAGKTLGFLAGFRLKVFRQRLLLI